MISETKFSNTSHRRDEPKWEEFYKQPSCAINAIDASCYPSVQAIQMYKLANCIGYLTSHAMLPTCASYPTVQVIQLCRFKCYSTVKAIEVLPNCASNPTVQVQVLPNFSSNPTLQVQVLLHCASYQTVQATQLCKLPNFVGLTAIKLCRLPNSAYCYTAVNATKLYRLNCAGSSATQLFK